MPAVAASRSFQGLTAVALLPRVLLVMPSTWILCWLMRSSRVDVRCRSCSLSGESKAFLLALRVFVLTGLHECIDQGEAWGLAQFARETRVQQTHKETVTNKALFNSWRQIIALLYHVLQGHEKTVDCLAVLLHPLVYWMHEVAGEPPGDFRVRLLSVFIRHGRTEDDACLGTHAVEERPNPHLIRCCEHVSSEGVVLELL